MTYEKPKWLLNEEAAEALEHCNDFVDRLQNRISELETERAAATQERDGLRVAAVQGFIDVLNSEQSDTPAKDMSTVAHANLRHFGYKAIQVDASEANAEHCENEYVAKALAQAAAVQSLTVPESVNVKLLKFVQGIESADYSEHGDYVKSCELMMWQERAKDLIAELETVQSQAKGEG